MQKRLKIGLITALIAVLAVSAVAAQSFNFIFNQTSYEPSQYSWTEPWEVKEVVDFVEATLTLTGSGYQSTEHDFELILKNISPEPTYYITSMDYKALWIVGTENETITEGSYLGNLLPNENVTYLGTWTPTIFGVGNVQMEVFNIVWAEAELITWTTEVDDTAAPLTGQATITDFVVTGASLSVVESGTVSFTVTNIKATGQIHIVCEVKIVELGLTVGTVDEFIPEGEFRNYSFDFAPLASGGAYTMRIVVTNI